MTDSVLLKVENLCAGVPEKEIIKNMNLTVNRGEIHVIMGPNGAGKSTLSYVLAGKPEYTVTAGTAAFNGKDLLKMKPEERALNGLFLSMQYPVAIPGVSVSSFLKHAVNARQKFLGLPELDAPAFLKLLREKARSLNIAPDMLKRDINVSFSGGEKKRIETLQMSLLEPQLAILDETDSGLDIDALKIVAEGINTLHNPENALLIITHHRDLLRYLNPDFVHIYADGHIIKTGNASLAAEVENTGYGEFIKAVR